ncbi:hypothetical protein PI125_g13735 [Phytophthora idaei]|nr:hypothetical protein PI125_g13735 [Phytophthora idaei]
MFGRSGECSLSLCLVDIYVEIMVFNAVASTEFNGRLSSLSVFTTTFVRVALHPTSTGGEEKRRRLSNVVRMTRST